MVALDAVRASGAPHAFLSVSKQGVAGIVETTGNRDCHVVLPAVDIKTSLPRRKANPAAELPTKVMVHCNAQAGAKGGASSVQGAQMKGVHDVADLVAGGDTDVLGVLLPSFLLGGKQPLGRGANGKQPTRTYGMSVTDLDWSATADALERLAAARRAAAALLSRRHAQDEAAHALLATATARRAGHGLCFARGTHCVRARETQATPTTVRVPVDAARRVVGT